MDKFDIDEKILEQNLFHYELPKVGPQTYLNINYLPYFLHSFTQKLSKKERSSLIEFDLQTYVLELALYNLKYKTIKELSMGLMREIRMMPKFWIPSSEAYNDVQVRSNIFHHIQNHLNAGANEENIGKIEDEIEQARKAIASMDFDNLDFKNEALKYPEVEQIIKSKAICEDSSSMQIAAIKKYVKWVEGVNGKIKEGFQRVSKQTTNDSLSKEDNGMPSNVFDWMSRYNVFDFYSQRETRQQAKNLTGGDQLSHRDIKILIREQQRIEMENKRTLWVPNKIYRFQKIDIIILPYVFQFLIKPKSYTRNHLRLQNFIMYLVMTDQELSKSQKLKKNIILSQSDKEHKTSQKQFQKFLKSSNDKIMNEFNQYCQQQENICLAFYFSSVPAMYRKELILLRNILLLSYTFATQILNDELQFQFKDYEESGNFLNTFNDAHQKQIDDVDQQEDQDQVSEQEAPTKNNIQSYQKWKNNQNDYFYLQVLHQLELYYAIPPDQYLQLVEAYIQNIEIIYTTKKDYFIQYFTILRNFEKYQIMGCRLDRTETDKTTDAYLKYFEAPKTLEQRSYMFHTSQRSDWNEDQYKLFLQGLQKYFEIVVNNKKIAKLMGENINQNHVRFVKGQYLRQLKKRAKEQNMSRKDILKNDIENYDSQTFDFLKKKMKALNEEDQNSNDRLINQENKNEETTAAVTATKENVIEDEAVKSQE